MEVLMLEHVPAAALAKAKVLALITASLAAGGVGGAVALSHVAPSSHLVRDVAATSTEDPETADATVDPETADATDPETADAEDVQDPETADATGDESTDGETADATVTTKKVKEHGHGASSWSGNGHGRSSG
jgi:hypothetical protein